MSVIPRKSEFSENCLSPRPQPNIEKKRDMNPNVFYSLIRTLHFEALNDNISASSGRLSR